MNLEPDTLPPNAFAPGESGFPNPDWEAISQSVESTYDECDYDTVWREIARIWVKAISSGLKHDYGAYESSDFIILTNSTEEKTSELMKFVKSADQSIRNTIPDLLPESLYGLCPILVFSSDHDFYRYVSEYIREDGNYGGMGGIFINRGYGHFAMPSADLSHYVNVVSHELCHSYLSHLGLPLWLDEAITGGVEHSVTGSNPYILDKEIIRRHQQFWTQENIQEFWSGESFYRPDDGQELSYHLARFILHALNASGHTPSGDMTAFYLSANWGDAGESAANEVLGLSLGDCLTGLLGEGSWSPPIPEPPSVT